MQLADIKVECHGPAATHNFPCPVCGIRPAVLMMNTGVFEPCRKCEADDWRVTRVSRFERVMRRLMLRHCKMEFRKDDDA